MRILFVVHQFLPEFAAGTERATLNLAKCAQRDGHSVDILTCSLFPGAKWSENSKTGLRSASFDGLRVYGIPRFEASPLEDLGFERNDLSHLDRLLDRTSYDLVHVTHGMRMLGVLEAIRERQIPYVITLTDFFLMCWRINLVRASGALCSGPAAGAACIRHCSTLALDDSRLLTRRDRTSRILESACAVIACSEFVAAIFRAEYPDLSIRVVEHGIDLLKFDPPAPRASSDTVTFGYIGNLSETKGVHVLAEAFARAAPAKARLKLVGPSYDDTLMLQLRNWSQECPAISIEPAVPAHDIPAMLGTFDVLCLPSLVPETFSLALHEGFAAGLPALVSDLGHPGFVVREHCCGEVVAAGDVQAWADAIGRVTARPSLLKDWRHNVPLPNRIEEEGFLYSQIYHAVHHRQRAEQAA
jgi:glycosyltransferase involved in cell wall biosynthesis